jgi:hypothetical protein
MNDYDGRTFQREGFTLEVSLTYDEHGGPEWLGRFTDNWGPDAIDHHEHSDYSTRNHPRWFIPANPEYGMEDYKRADSFGHEWNLLDMRVTASRCGIELGDATVGSIESDGGSDYFESYIEELTVEALSEANDALDALVKSVHPLTHLAKCAKEDG